MGILKKEPSILDKCFLLPQNVFYNRKLNRSDILVYCALFQSEALNQLVVITDQQIADFCKFHPQTAQKAIAKLSSLKLINIEHRYGGRYISIVR